MPEISRFYGIVIRMFFDDHHPPHFHARYGGDELVVSISSLAAIAGHLPPRAMGLVIEWASMHQDELMREWEKARAFQSLGKIDPLPQQASVVSGQAAVLQRESRRLYLTC